MIEPASGPFLFDTSAQSWLARANQPAIRAWISAYFSLHQAHFSAATVIERVRGYALLARQVSAERRHAIDALRTAYLRDPGRVWPIDATIAALAGEIMGMLPDPPSPPKRAHREAESRAERLAHWRFDVIIAATALVLPMPLIHNNAVDFEAIRGAIERSPGRFPGIGPLELIQCARLATRLV